MQYNKKTPCIFFRSHNKYSKIHREDKNTDEGKSREQQEHLVIANEDEGMKTKEKG